MVGQPHHWHPSFVLVLSGPSRLRPSPVPCLSLWSGRPGQCLVTAAHREPLGRNELLHLHWLCHGFGPPFMPWITAVFLEPITCY